MRSGYLATKLIAMLEAFRSQSAWSFRNSSKLLRTHWIHSLEEVALRLNSGSVIEIGILGKAKVVFRQRSTFGKIINVKELQEIAEFYRKRFAYSDQYQIKEEVSPKLKLSIVIPCYDEDPFPTLESLGDNTFDESKAEVILVFNHSENAALPVKEKHGKQVEEWHGTHLKNGVPVFSVAAFDLPKKHAGVGLARKIGMDLALQRFADARHDGLIVCLDADCKVSENYLAALGAAEKTQAKGLSISFEHQLENISEEEVLKRIVDYEIWLRYYIQALRFAGYPHAFHTIGSSMAVRASVYAKVGGMNRRKAGEDFYFLHKLIPQGHFYDLTETCVFPSSRISERVPFGTGRAMLEMQAGTKDFTGVYHPRIFEELRSFLNMKENIFRLELDKWPPAIAAFAEKQNWERELLSLKKRSRDNLQLMTNFQYWLDGFKVLKLVHFLRDNAYGSCDVEEACKQLFSISSVGSDELLQRLHKLDSNTSTDKASSPKKLTT